MWKRLAALVRRETGVQGDERLLALEREAQTLRLELSERERQLGELRGALEHQRQGNEAWLQQSLHSQWEALVVEAAGPAAQLLTQAYLLEQGRPVQARDVLAVARRLIGSLESRGMGTLQQVGENLPYDPARHEPISAAPLTAGQPVTVRFVGIAYRGKIVRRAGVSPVSMEVGNP